MGIKYFNDFEGTWTDGPKVYVATFSQSGTDAPVVTILDNTIGDIIWNRSGSGDYRGYLDNAFITFPTIVFSFGFDNDVIRYGFIEKIGDGEIRLVTKDKDFNWQDDLLSNTLIEFKVYQ